MFKINETLFQVKVDGTIIINKEGRYRWLLPVIIVERVIP